MEITVHEGEGTTVIEGVPGVRLLARAEEVNRLIEACWEQGAQGVLLYPENLTEHFFDLSSGEAGTILQKLRNYRVALALVRTPSLELGRYFTELLRDEQRGNFLRLFDTRDEALAWLQGGEALA